MSDSESTVQPAPPDGPAPARSRRLRSNRDGESRSRSERRALISSILVASLVIHLVGLIALGIWTVAKRFQRPEARFEVKKTVTIPPQKPEHRMNVARHEAMAARPALRDTLASIRPTPFALPNLPLVAMDQVLTPDPSALVADQVASLVGSAGLGRDFGSGLGGGGKGGGASFFGIQADGQRILLLFDVSASVVNKAKASGIPLERIQTETLALIDGLPIAAQFSLIQFTGNYLPFSEELVAATPGNKVIAKEWIQAQWVTSGTMAASKKGVISNRLGLVGVLERAARMRPEIVFLLSDASFQWRPGEDGGFSNIPYPDLKKAVDRLEEENRRKIPLNFLAFTPRADDADEWKRIIRRTGGEFRILKTE